MTEGVSHEPDGHEESDPERAKRLVSHLDRATYNAFQAYWLDVGKEDIGRPHDSGRDPWYEDEIDRYSRILESYDFPKPAGVYLPPFGHLYVHYGEVSDKYIVEGAGRIEHERGGEGRETYSSFTLRFDDPGAQSEFLDWLRTDAKGALGNTFGRSFNEYDDAGNLVRKNFPHTDYSSGKSEDPIAGIEKIAAITKFPNPQDPKPGRRIANWVRSLRRR